MLMYSNLLRQQGSLFKILLFKVIILKIYLLVDLATPVVSGDNATKVLIIKVPELLLKLHIY